MNKHDGSGEHVAELLVVQQSAAATPTPALHFHRAVHIALPLVKHDSRATWSAALSLAYRSVSSANGDAKQLLLNYEEGIKLVSLSCPDGEMALLKQFDIRTLEERFVMVTAGFVRSYADTRRAIRDHKGVNRGMLSGVYEEGPSVKDCCHWICVAVGAGMSTSASSTTHRLVFLDSDTIPPLHAEAHVKINYVKTMLSAQSVRFPHRTNTPIIAFSPPTARMLIPLIVPKYGQPFLAFLRQRVISDFPGAMYPLGFNLLQSCETYIEAEDELDVVVGPRGLIRNSSGALVSTRNTHAYTPEEKSAVLDIGCSFTHRAASASNATLHSSASVRLPFDASQFERCLAENALAQTSRKDGFFSPPSSGSKGTPLLSKPTMVEAALMSYSQVWASKRVHSDTGSISVPLGLWGSEFDPTYNGAVAARGSAANEAATGAGSAGITSVDPATIAADERGPGMRFTSFLRLPLRVASGEYRKILGARVASALALQNLHGDELCTKTRMDHIGLEAYETAVASFERQRKAEFARADKEKKVRLDYLQTVEMAHLHASAAGAATGSKMPDVSASAPMETGASVKTTPVTAAAPAAVTAAVSGAGAGVGTVTVTSLETLPTNPMTAEQTSDKLAMLTALQQAKEEEQRRASSEQMEEAMAIA